MAIRAVDVLGLLLKRAQEAPEPNPEPVAQDDNYTHSKLLPPLVPQPPPEPQVPVPVAIPTIGPPVKKYIPPPQPGHQTAGEVAAWRALLKAQGGQGTAGVPTPVPGYGPAR